MLAVGNGGATAQSKPHRRRKKISLTTNPSKSIPQNKNILERDDYNLTPLGYVVFSFLGFTLITQGAYLAMFFDFIGLI